MRKVQKFWGLLFAVLSVLVIFQEKTIAQTPYGIFDEETGTLTLGYGETLPQGAKEINVNPYWDYIGQNITSAQNVKTIIFDNSFADFKPTTCAYWFYGCLYLTEIQYIGNLKTDNVTNMSAMFLGCSSLTSLDVSNFKTDNVTNMSSMFNSCSGLTSLDVSNFKTDNVTNMDGMFRDCSSLTRLDLSNFKTDNVTDMSSMFEGCSSLTSLDVSNFKTDNVTDMWSMFQFCSGLTSLDVSNFKTDNVTDMGSMFSYCSSLTSLDLSNFKTDNVTSMGGMFSSCSSLTSLDLSNFKTDNVTYMSDMFFGCSSLTNLDVSNFKTDNVTNMSYMFYGCESLTSLDVSNFKTDNVTDMGSMFSGCSSLTSLDVSNFKTDNVTDMWEMFSGCSSLTSLDVSNFKTDNVTDMWEMFYNCKSLTSLDVSNFKTDNVTKMDWMFWGCSSLTSLDVSNFKTDKVTNMYEMFGGCSGLTSLDLSNFKTDNVTNMGSMFSGCSSLTSLDVSNFKTDNVTDMSSMFFKCENLKTIYVDDNWNTDAVTSSIGMFYNCSNLHGGKGTKYDSEKTEKTYARLDGGEENPGYFTEKAIISIKSFPTKTQYFEGEDIDLSGGKILLSYKISEDEIINMTNEKVSFSKNNNTIEILYNGEKIGKFDITIKAVEVEKIVLTTLPEKVEYFVGEDFSANGGVLKITYNNGDTKTIDLTADGVKISGFDKNKAAKQTLKIEAFGKETTFGVLVKAKSAVSISITTSPKKTEYIKGEKLDVSEGEITVKYDNGDKETVDLSVAEISGYDRNKVGKQTLTVEYQGLTTTFDVEVEQENIIPKPENPETKTDDIVITENVKIWSSGKTIFVENGGKEIFIVDMSGKIVKTVKPDSNRIEIQMSKGGIYIVKTNSKTQKVIIR